MGAWPGSICCLGGRKGNHKWQQQKGKTIFINTSLQCGREKLPTYCCVSENGSITAELLDGMLKHMDDSGIFPQNNGPPNLFLILDGLETVVSKAVDVLQT